jgi:hypothetical protein
MILVDWRPYRSGGLSGYACVELDIGLVMPGTICLDPDPAPRPSVLPNSKRSSASALLSRRREQLAAVAKSEQLALFELREDRRPIADRAAADRYLEPSLFSFPEREG